jgi:hypothetical protein
MAHTSFRSFRNFPLFGVFFRCNRASGLLSYSRFMKKCIYQFNLSTGVWVQFMQQFAATAALRRSGTLRASDPALQEVMRVNALCGILFRPAASDPEAGAEGPLYVLASGFARHLESAAAASAGAPATTPATATANAGAPPPPPPVTTTHGWWGLSPTTPGGFWDASPSVVPPAMWSAPSNLVLASLATHLSADTGAVSVELWSEVAAPFLPRLMSMPPRDAALLATALAALGAGDSVAIEHVATGSSATDLIRLVTEGTWSSVDSAYFYGANVFMILVGAVL